MRLSNVRIVPEWLRSLERIELLLAGIITLSIYGDAFPYRTPIVFPLIVLAFGWVALVQRRLVVPMNAGFAFTVVCIAFYLIGMLETSYVYRLNLRDLRNAASLLLLSPLLFSLRNVKSFQNFCARAQVLGAVTGVILAIVGLYKYNLMAQDKKITFFLFEGRQYPWGTSLIVDYNFYAYAMLAGAISCLFCLHRFPSFSAKALSLFGMILTIASMSLSGSRRGWITEALFLAVLAGLILRWLGLALWRAVRSALDSKISIKSVAVLLTVGLITPLVVKKINPSFLDSDRKDFQVQSKSLFNRFNGLSDPAGGFEGRSDRWVFASHLLDDAPPVKLFFGQGFDYLHTYAVEFPGDTPEDYPHNPIISAALFSGIIGGVVVCLFLGLASWRYITCRRTDVYFASLYLASLFFVIPSYNSIFSGKFFGILLLIPWSIPAPAKRASHATSPINRPEFVYPRLTRPETAKYSL